MSNDVALIQQILTGDETAFTTLVGRYQGMVFSLAYHYVEDFQDAEEGQSDTQIRVLRSR